MRDVVNEVDNLEFKSSEQKHELSALYEEKIKNMGNAGRNGGEYYTPRPLIKSIIKVIDPKVGETIYDGAVGSAGFLVEAFEHMSKSKKLKNSSVGIINYHDIDFIAKSLFSTVSRSLLSAPIWS